ncbi:hypothetical protein QQ045_013039 [Rhodiola kirilowii]
MAMGVKLGLGFLLLLLLSVFCCTVDSQCSRTCDALASYYVWSGTNTTFIAEVLDSTPEEIVSYNSGKLTNKDSLPSFIRINVPFSCECIRDVFLGHTFSYKVRSGDTYTTIAETYYANLTTASWVQEFNTYPANNIPDTNAYVNVTVNCSCGDSSVSKEYGLFMTYPLRSGDTLASIANESGVSAELLTRYNPTANFNAGSGIVYVPGKGLGAGPIAGITIGSVLGVLVLALVAYYGIFRKRLVKGPKLLPVQSEDHSGNSRQAGAGNIELPSPRLAGVTVDKSVEFSYEELATATENFSLSYKIGQGGFGAVYYAELRGERAAIKKMDMQASKEFLAELKVLTHVHHLNLLRLIGYCVEGSLFLVYEFIENGNLSEHLHRSDREPLSWSTRVQIALDAARGLEYIHEHTVPVYIHRDIKSANILIDKNFHGKVADFGLTKLTEVGSNSLPTRLVGTFGYMPPEYARYGDVSPKIDVFAFGVVLYELISAKEAIVRINGSTTESKGLVALFDEVLDQPEPKDDLIKLIDPRLEDNYPFDSVRKMAQLAKACTHDNPQLRPSMRSIVVALMTLSSSTEDWDIGAFYENQALANLMSGR